jgi:hypothetical protein
VKFKALFAVLAVFACGSAAAGPFVEAGGACAQDHGDGIWYQEAFPHKVQLCGPTFAVGYRAGAWSFGAAHLFRTSSTSQATVRDQDYDSKAHKCLDNCDAPATFETKGSAYGAFVRYEWRPWRGAIVEAGALVFQPRMQVVVSNWRENGDPANPAVRGVYTHKREVGITPSIGLGWKAGDVRAMARFYPWVKVRKDSLDGSSVTGLYNGPTGTLTLSYDF